jgi:hypothetical protein
MEVGGHTQMNKLAAVLLCTSSVLFGQYKVETAGAPPAAVASGISGALDKQGVKIVGPNGQVFCELWFRGTPPPSSATKEDASTWTGVAHGTLVGVVNFPSKTSDRRGNPVNAGVYTMRLSFFPVNGDHQGVAPQRDFLLLSKAEEDTDPASTPAFDPLVAMSKKVTGSPHPAVFSMWKVENDFKPGFEKMGENDWVLQVKVAGTQLAIILIGKAEG